MWPLLVILQQPTINILLQFVKALIDFFPKRNPVERNISCEETYLKNSNPSVTFYYEATSGKDSNRIAVISLTAADRSRT